ncbi:RDD family protein [Lachnospiraceae bacterium 42-17]|jgi:uncharacterized RDD family membrane protein YckC|nr:RDD family protein [Dorea sp.]
MLNNWNKNTLTYGGFWVRLAAYTIDSMIVFFALLLVRLLSSGLLSLADGTALGGNVLFSYTLKDIILYVFEALYFILFTYYTETTPGKRLLNLYVKAADGKKLTLTDVMYRETIGRFLCGATVLIGYIMAGVDKEKRGLHDMLCDTRVVYMKKIKVYPGFQMPQDINIPPVPRQVTQPPYMPYGQPPHMPGGMPPDMPSKHTPGRTTQDMPPQHMPGTQRPPDLGSSYRMVRPEDENKERDS